MGFTLLGEILSKSGHQVKVIDYTFLRWLKNGVYIPSFREILEDFSPDVIGISVFTYLYDECNKLIAEISHLSKAPIILGGPHATLFPEDFMQDNRVSYIVRGEAENIILDLVNNASRQPIPVIINCLIPDPEDIPSINLDIALGSNYLKEYQIQLSRGCPFDCSFCNIDLISGRRVRSRDLQVCINQIKEAKDRYPNIKMVTITDDCPNFNKERFKQFLRKFAEINIDCILIVDNMRADLIDEETVKLYKSAGGRNICLGVENGNPEVFRLINKRESLEKIIYAAELCHNYNLELGLCFVIGLPGDSLKRTRDSIDLANKLKPVYIFWNMCIPWPNTKVYDWFKENGTIENIRNFSTLIDTRIGFGIPPAFSPNFTKEERIKAWLMANLETYTLPILSWGNLRYLPFNILKIFHLSVCHKIIPSFFKYLTGFVFYKSGQIIVLLLRRFFGTRKLVKNRSTYKYS